ncbi:MAG: hypothetical protein HFI12_03760 [Lachnospiraceae bacterium]|jgi:hypothetical protein|nr:hypothetical protein [Lachnospiraceae bacterium]
MNKKKHNIIFIYEGVKTEEDLLNNMAKTFFSDRADISILNCPADGNIYMLWTRLKKDEFETNVIDVLKEMSSIARTRLKDCKASDFSEIYLFFDYDGHSNNIPREYMRMDILEEMLKTFQNETEFGKLYISYPMVESLKEIDAETMDYQRLYLSLDEIPTYKHSFLAKSDFGQYRYMNEKHWLIACYASLKRASLLAKYSNCCTYEYFIYNLGQEKLYWYQKQHYINNGYLLCILNSVPLFLLEYFEKDFWDNIFFCFTY